MDIEKQFVDWLKDAYLMEVHYAKALEEHLGPAKDYPRLHRLIDEHLWATTSHAYEVGLCLERLNWNVKDLSCRDRSSLHAPFEQPPSTKQDTVIDNIIVEVTTEYFEIARYIEIITAATNLGDPLTIRVCEAILEDEEAMAGEADR
jgi:ferritin-like metal-binding protein YciE